MLKKLFRGLIGRVVKNRVVAEVIAETADDVLMGVADKHTDGLASQAERVVKRHKK